MWVPYLWHRGQESGAGCCPPAGLPASCLSRWIVRHPTAGCRWSTWLPMDILWDESKGLMKGVLWELSQCCRCRLASEWHCSSFREQKSQRAQGVVCRRPRLSQTWGQSVVERRRLRPSRPGQPGPSPQTIFSLRPFTRLLWLFSLHPSPRAPQGSRLSSVSLHPS